MAFTNVTTDEKARQIHDRSGAPIRTTPLQVRVPPARVRVKTLTIRPYGRAFSNTR